MSFKKIIIAILVAVVALFAFRALALTVYTIEGTALEPDFKSGDRIMVNRWSYGLRTGETNGLFGYGRLGFSMPKRGDVIAFDNPSPYVEGVFVGRIMSLPGDTLTTSQGPFLVPGVATCARQNLFVVEMGKNHQQVTIPESSIIGRIVLVVYNHDDSQAFYSGFNPDRWMKRIRNVDF
ncbi:MAG: signal peptidase I [Prevotella sp.]